MNYKDLRDLRLGGIRDGWSLFALGAGAMASNPFFYEVPYASMIGASLAAIGGAAVGSRMMTAYKESAILESAVSINSNEPPKHAKGGTIDMDWLKDKPIDGFLLGYTSDTGKPVVVPYEYAMRHMLIVGQSGVGKTVLGRFMMLQQIMAGGSVIFVDGKMNSDDIQMMFNYCCYAGRQHDFMVINPGNPELSNTYNPILSGDPDEVSARILSLIPSTEGNAGADYYKQSANQGITTIVAALQRAGLAYNFIDISILLQNPIALGGLEKKVPPSDEKTSLSLFLDQFRIAGKDNKTMLDMKRIKETFGGVGGRMFSFGTGDFKKVTSSYTPDVKLFDAIMSGKVIYMPLPTMGKQVAANNFGMMEIGDLRTAVSWIQALPESQRPWPPVLNFFDEAGSYVNNAWSRMFEQARSAHMILCPAIQTNANFEAISKELSEMITGNTWTKMIFKIGTQGTADTIAELIGKESKITTSLSSGGSSSSSAQKAKPGSSDSNSDGSSVGFSEKEEEVYKVTAQDLKDLGPGEAIVIYGGSNVYHIKVPLASLTSEITKEIGKMKINTYRKRFSRGINLFNKAEMLLSTNNKKDDKDE